MMVETDSMRVMEILSEATNIIASLFYGVVLGIFLVAFFIKHVRGTAVFWAALGAEVIATRPLEVLPPDAPLPGANP